MKVLLYSDHLKEIHQSGLGKSIKHQEKALALAGISYTTDHTTTDYDILHINTYFPSSIKFAKAAKQAGKKIVYHAHSTEEDFKHSFRFSNQLAPLFKRWLIHAYQFGDVLVAPTPYAKNLLKSYGLSMPIYSISNGIDLQLFEPISQARQKLLTQFPQLDKNAFLVMGIGLYLERKGILDFVELAKRLPDVQFVWFGSTDFKLVPNHIKTALTHHPKNLFLAGYVDNETIRLALQATDLYLFPTFEETEGIPAIEACASKTPFIVRNIPVFDGWLTHSENVYKAQSIDEFETYIQQARRGELPDLTDAAYQVALDRDLTVVGQQLKHVYTSL